MKTKTQRFYYRSGRLFWETPSRNGQVHGVARTWHHNGIMASEERYQKGRLHGLCRQWAEDGRLLGEYRMKNGTGIQRSWHDNGRLRQEFSTVRGWFSGRSRDWSRNGVLLSDRLYVENRTVSPVAYRAARRSNPDLPVFRGRPGRVLRGERARAAEIQSAFVQGALTRSDLQNAETWLSAGPASKRHLGRFKSHKAAARFISDLSRWGATTIDCLNLSTSRKGEEFCEGLLVGMPSTVARRHALRRNCRMALSRGLGAVVPMREIGETHLFITMT